MTEPDFEFRLPTSVIDLGLWFFATRRKIRRHRRKATTAARATHALRFFIAICGKLQASAVCMPVYGTLAGTEPDPLAVKQVAKKS